jgi:hypothetical protein
MERILCIVHLLGARSKREYIGDGIGDSRVRCPWTKCYYIPVHSTIAFVESYSHHLQFERSRVGSSCRWSFLIRVKPHLTTPPTILHPTPPRFLNAKPLHAARHCIALGLRNSLFAAAHTVGRVHAGLSVDAQNLLYLHLLAC